MKITLPLIYLFLSISAFAAESEIEIKIEDLTNIRGNGAMEACGTAIHKTGIKPVMVTIKHDASFYTTLTAPNGKWCAVIKRWTFNGEIDVSATTLDNPSFMDFRSYPIQK